MILECDADLPNVIHAFRAPCGLAGRLDSRQKQSNQDPDNRDDDEQLDQREAGASTAPQPLCD
jgi:hypothetical protein